MIQFYKLFNSTIDYVDEIGKTAETLAASVLAMANQNREIFMVFDTLTNSISILMDRVGALIDNQNIAASNFETMQSFINKTEAELESHNKMIDFLMRNCSFLVSQNIEKDRKIAELEKIITNGMNIEVLGRIDLKINRAGFVTEQSVQQHLSFSFPMIQPAGTADFVGITPAGTVDFDDDTSGIEGDDYSGDDYSGDDYSGDEDDDAICPICGQYDCDYMKPNYGRDVEDEEAED